MSPKIYLTGAASAEMFSRLPQKCFGATQRCPPPPKNVTFHPRMFGCHPKIVLLHPKMFWVHPKRFGAPQLFLCLPRDCSEIAGLGSAGFSKRTHHDGIGTPIGKHGQLNRSVPQQLLGANGVQLSQASCFLQVLPMVLCAQNVLVHVVGKRLRLFRITHVQAQVIRIEIVVLVAC